MPWFFLRLAHGRTSARLSLCVRRISFFAQFFRRRNRDGRARKLEAGIICSMAQYFFCLCLQSSASNRATVFCEWETQEFGCDLGDRLEDEAPSPAISG